MTSKHLRHSKILGIKISFKNKYRSTTNILNNDIQKSNSLIMKTEESCILLYYWDDCENNVSLIRGVE